MLQGKLGISEPMELPLLPEKPESMRLASYRAQTTNPFVHTSCLWKENLLRCPNSGVMPFSAACSPKMPCECKMASRICLPRDIPNSTADYLAQPNHFPTPTPHIPSQSSAIRISS